jgi:hypothetical protein
MLSALVTLLLAADGGTPLPKITTKNWQHHPHVESARAVFTEVRAALDAKHLTSREARDCTQEFSAFITSTDEKGVVRLLVREFGNSDSTQRAEAYYDAAGRLRFVFVQVRAVPSSWVEARFWLDEGGTLVWKTRAMGGEGPGYYAYDPAEYLVKDPARYVEERTRCPPL